MRGNSPKRRAAPAPGARGAIATQPPAQDQDRSRNHKFVCSPIILSFSTLENHQSIMYYLRKSKTSARNVFYLQRAVTMKGQRGLLEK